MSVSSVHRKAVAERAAGCCEYCRLASLSTVIPFHIEHIIPLKHGGSDDLDNLCLACYKCNAHKGHDLTGIDPLSGDITRLYHPRQHHWTDHFALQPDMRLRGLTPEGRTTIRVLNMNDEKRVENRQVLFELGEYPC